MGKRIECHIYHGWTRLLESGTRLWISSCSRRLSLTHIHHTMSNLGKVLAIISTFFLAHSAYSTYERSYTNQCHFTFRASCQ